MRLKNLTVIFVLYALSGCGYGSYRKTDDGSVENTSRNTLEVKVSEGCYGGNTHSFSVAPGETSPFSYSYQCDGHDDESADIRIAYVGYEERGYVFYSFDPSPYTNTVFAEGSVGEFSEDHEQQSHSLTMHELNAIPEMGLRSDLMVYTYRQTIRIRPSTESVAQLFYGIPKSQISPFIPLISGNFESNDVVYQPMVKDYYQHNPSYSGQKLSLVCDDINCVAQ